MTITGQLVEISSLFSPSRSWALNSGCQTWKHTHLFTESFDEPLNINVEKVESILVLKWT